MPNRIPTPGVKTPAVRKSPIATSSAKPKIDLKYQKARHANSIENSNLKPLPKKSTGPKYPVDPTKVKGFKFGGGTQ